MKEALSKGQPEIFNTDQGNQYTGEASCGLLTDQGIKVIMDGKGRYLDSITVGHLTIRLDHRCPAELTQYTQVGDKDEE